MDKRSAVLQKSHFEDCKKLGKPAKKKQVGFLDGFSEIGITVGHHLPWNPTKYKSKRFLVVPRTEAL